MAVEPYRSREDALEHQIKVLEEELEDTKRDLRHAKKAKEDKGYKIDPFIFTVVFCFACSLLMVCGAYTFAENKIAAGLVTGSLCLLISGDVLAVVGTKTEKFK